MTVRVQTYPNIGQFQGEPLDAAVWLVARLGEHADAQGVSGPPAEVDECYGHIAYFLREEAMA